MLNIITGINEMKTLTKHISCKYLMEENVIQIIVDVSVKNIMYVKKMFWIFLNVVVKMETIIMDNTAIMCDEVIESFDEEVEAKSYDLEKQFQQILTIKISLR